MSQLLDLMRRLGSDAALHGEYENDPRAVIGRFGLSDEERAALLAKDHAAIRRLTGLQDGPFATHHTLCAYDR